MGSDEAPGAHDPSVCPPSLSGANEEQAAKGARCAGAGRGAGTWRGVRSEERGTEVHACAMTHGPGPLLGGAEG